jgi:hypothetical protein
LVLVDDPCGGILERGNTVEPILDLAGGLHALVLGGVRHVLDIITLALELIHLVA